MSDIMNFPDTVEEFMEQYKITDTEQIYTNGTELVPIFRMKQWFEHLYSVEPEIIRCKDCEHWERQTWKGVPLSWGHCESEIMWDSIDGETYEVAHITTNENHFCGYAERKKYGRFNKQTGGN